MLAITYVHSNGGRSGGRGGRSGGGSHENRNSSCAAVAATVSQLKIEFCSVSIV